MFLIDSFCWFDAVTHPVVHCMGKSNPNYFTNDFASNVQYLCYIAALYNGHNHIGTPIHLLQPFSSVLEKGT